MEAVHVDRSLPGCYGFIITTGNATIAYSGDLRMHDRHPVLTRDFVEKVAEAKPDVFRC